METLTPKDRLINYLMGFWYTKPGHCLDKRWIEEHAEEILRVLEYPA